MAYHLVRHWTSTCLAWSFSELLGASESRSLSEPLGASWSFSEPLTCQVAYHLVGHLTSTCLAWSFGTSRSFSELHGTSRSFSDPLGASYLASGLPFGRPPDKYPPCLCPACPLPALPAWFQLEASKRGATKPASASCPEPRVSAATGSEQ